MTKLILAGGLVLIAIAAAPLRVSALDYLNDHYYPLGETNRGSEFQGRYRISKETRARTGAEVQQMIEADKRSRAANALQRRLTDLLKTIPGFERHYVSEEALVKETYELNFRSEACGDKCNVVLVVGNIVWDPVSFSKPRLVLYNRDKIIERIDSESIADFMEKTRDGALIKEKVAKLKLESLAAYYRQESSNSPND